jgi:hypothetical protein
MTSEPMKLGKRIKEYFGMDSRTTIQEIRKLTKGGETTS